MAKVKVPEFKVGETVEASKFNEAFDQFKSENLSLDGDNFADQAFGFDQIPKDISLTDLDKFMGTGASLFEFTTKTMQARIGTSRDPWVTPYTSFSGVRSSSVNHPHNNIIQLRNLSAGDMFIIRASCVIDTIDGGWRTFMFGIPPTVKIGLVRFEVRRALISVAIPQTLTRSPFSKHWLITASHSRVKCQALHHLARLRPLQHRGRDQVRGFVLTIEIKAMEQT